MTIFKNLKIIFKLVLLVKMKAIFALVFIKFIS